MQYAFLGQLTVWGIVRRRAHQLRAGLQVESLPFAPVYAMNLDLSATPRALEAEVLLGYTQHIRQAFGTCRL